MSKNSKIKKKIGEQAYQYLIRNFSDDFLSEYLPELFGLVPDVRHIKEVEYPKIKKLLNSKLEEPIEKKEEVKKTAKELLDKAGFVLYDEIQNKEDYEKFKKYFETKEELCKFKSYNATTRYHKLFWIVRKDIDSINRADYPNPKRQDLYSTSCMSVGISKDKQNVVQITSRYNHAVNGCDNTYNSNLDNIVEGLTEAFNRDYGLGLRKSSQFEFKNFYYMNGKYWFYYYEREGRKFGNNTVDGVLYDSNQYLVFENYLLDLKNKKIENLLDHPDSFVKLTNKKLQEGAKIEIRKGEPPETLEDKRDLILFFI